MLVLEPVRVLVHGLLLVLAAVMVVVVVLLLLLLRLAQLDLQKQQQ